MRGLASRASELFLAALAAAGLPTISTYTLLSLSRSGPLYPAKTPIRAALFIRSSFLTSVVLSGAFQQTRTILKIVGLDVVSSSSVTDHARIKVN